MRKSIKAFATVAAAVASTSLAVAPAFADSYSRYQGGVVAGYTSHCTVLIDSMYNDTKNYWVARAAYQATYGGVCRGELLRQRSGSETWEQIGSVRVFGPGKQWSRTDWIWDGPGAKVQACIWADGDPGDSACTLPY
ncbi:hypothetical protein [Streptomyces olivoreticuli]|uniref:hypothetical protein n=1 Tax=Streptomyces olivoreticuli TaxID=68246 RepID=UPI0013C2CD25|nr:hypothetical protein [Streptomyces olivoreticuli]